MFDKGTRVTVVLATPSRYVAGARTAFQNQQGVIVGIDSRPTMQKKYGGWMVQWQPIYCVQFDQPITNWWGGSDIQAFHFPEDDLIRIAPLEGTANGSQD